MTYKIEYELKTDSIGRNYALRIDLKSGKKQRIPYKEGKKKYTRQLSDRKRNDIKKQIADEGIKAPYKEYQRQYKSSEIAIIKDYEKKGKKLPGKKGLHTKVKDYVIKEKLGVRTYFKYIWIWSVKVYYKDIDGKMKYDCDTGYMMSQGKALNGDHVEGFKELVKNAYERIPSRDDLCYLDGGSCIRIYQKSDGKILNKYEMGRGCGYFIDFKTYDYDTSLLKEPDLIDL